MAQPGVRKLFAYIEREKVDIVLCHTLDRLCSRFDVASRLLSELARKGIELWAADPGERITARNLSEYYIDDRSKMFAMGSHVAHVPDDLREEKHFAPLPFGYRYAGACNADGQRIFGFKVVDPVAADVIRRIFGMYAEGMAPTRSLLSLMRKAWPVPAAVSGATLRSAATAPAEPGSSTIRLTLARVNRRATITTITYRHCASSVMTSGTA